MSRTNAGPPAPLRLVFGSVRVFICGCSVSVTTILDVGSTGLDGVVVLGSGLGLNGDKKSS